MESLVHRDYAVVMVYNKPYCFWDYEDILTKNMSYINAIDQSYFSFLSRTYFQKLKIKKYTQQAAIAIRTSYSHGLETLFSLLGAFIQSPYFVPGWILLCKNKDLYNLIKLIGSYKKVPSISKIDCLDWHNISQMVFSGLKLDNKELEKRIIKEFSLLWSAFASEFTNESFVKEYNSIKHGLRIHPGGFTVAVGPQKQVGIPAPKESMHTFGSSEFGSSFLDNSRVDAIENHHYLKRISRNWNPEDMVWGLEFISLSIANIKSALKIFNGVEGKDVKFSWPKDFETFHEPRKRTVSIGVTSMAGSLYSITEDFITNFDEQKLRDLYSQGKYLHRNTIKVKTPDL